MADILGGENTGLTRDIENFSPMSGRMIKEDGTVVNIAENIGGGVTPEQIQAAVDQYLEENPVSADLPQGRPTAPPARLLRSPPNQYHTWGEVAALTLTLAAEEAGVVNEYHFAFDSGTTATTLSLPEGIQTDIVVEPSTQLRVLHYRQLHDLPGLVFGGECMTMTRRRLLDDTFKKTVEGNPAIATDSLARMYPGITMQGWTEQAKTTGAQLLDESTIEQGFINGNTGEEADSANMCRSGFIPIKPNTQYYFFGSIQKLGIFL